MFVSISRRMVYWTVAIAALLFAISPGLARAEDPKPAATALGKVPADVDAYGANLHMGKTIEQIGKTRLWKQVWEDPAVQELWKKAKAAYNGDDDEEGAKPVVNLSSLKKFLDAPGNKEIPGLALDAVSNEIFFYAGAGTGDFVGLLQDSFAAARYGPLFQMMLEGNPGQDPNQAQLRHALKVLSEKPERIRIPNIVFGLKVSEPAKVSAQLKRLDSLVADALKETPLKGRSERVKVGGDEFLVLKLDGSLVPWDMIPIAMFEEKEGEFAPLIKRLKALTLTIAVGVRQGYLLIAIGESAEHLAKFGGEGPKLIDRPEFKPLAKVTDKPLTAVGYTSESIMAALATKPEDIAGFGDLAKAMLKKGELSDEQRKAIEKDVDAFVKEVAGSLRKQGAHTSFSYRTPQGWETFAYDYTEPSPGKSLPMPLLNHLGGNPLMAMVWRSGTTIEDYRTLVKSGAIVHGHIEKIASAKNPEAEQYLKIFRDDVIPLLKEANDITEKYWFPALADGQEGFVLDAKWTSKQWHLMMPETDRELPMPEFGIMVGVSDPAKLRLALEGYRAIINKAVAKAKEHVPTEIEIEIPLPKTEQKGGNTYAYYPIPAEWGIDRQFRPTAGLSAKVGVVALSTSHAERLLTESPLDTGMVPLSNLKRPIDSMFYINWAGIVESANPWVGWALARYAALTGDQAETTRIAQKIMSFLKVFRAYASVTYREGKATITHSEAVFQDIEP